MSRIQEILKDKDSVIAFDVDGCLAKLEFGEYNHYTYSDQEWIDALRNGGDFYDKDKVSPKLKAFIESKDINNIYVITKSYTEYEDEAKYKYLTTYYNILKDHIYCVREDILKKERLKEIKDKYPNLEDNKIIMVDDSVDVLTDIMDNTSFSTVHVSTFIDL